MAADREEEEELQMALRMSLQASSPPEAKRSKPREISGASAYAGDEESVEARNRRLQRELMASAAEKRIRAAVAASAGVTMGSGEEESSRKRTEVKKDGEERAEGTGEKKIASTGEEVPLSVVEELFGMVFGSGVSRDVLAQWSNQGIRYSTDLETRMGLVQHEGGPCGVLATIQAYVLKYLLFFAEDLGNPEITDPLYTLSQRRFYQTTYTATDDFSSISDERKARALVYAMVEILFLCGSGNHAVVASLQADQNESIDKVLEGLTIESASDLHKVLRVHRFYTRKSAFDHLTGNMSVFESRMGAMLFLISALLSRGLKAIQADRDDPSQPLVTAPFGHASQEIVNLLLCGEAVPNVFDGKMDLGGGMSLKGIPGHVEIGFLSLLESLNLCKVGQFLKCPRWPIWVIGSESHYTVLFALTPSVQDENELEERESIIRRAFDAHDSSGGGGFITVEGFHQVLRDTVIHFPNDKLESLCGAGFIVWSEFWQALLELDKNLGGMRDSSGLMGKKQFDIYHFNGIAKSVINNGLSARPRLCKLSVVVPPRWTQEEYLADVASCSASGGGGGGGESGKGEDGIVLALNADVANKVSQHAPLVDCVRTRWPRAVCSWVGDTPSIV